MQMMNEVADTSTSGGAVDAAAPAPAPAAPQADAAPAQPTSLLQRPAGEQAADKPATQPGAAPDWVAKVPAKSLVKGADGSPDMAATLAKIAESYTNLEKVRTVAPPSPAEYAFTPDPALGDVKLDDALSNSFREKAHKAGMSQDQYQMVMSEYLATVPQLLDSVAKLSADEARTELGKFWKGDDAMSKGISAAQRAIDGAPADLREAAWEKFGRDPDFIRFAAHYGQQMEEGTSPPNADGSGGNQSVDTLMASEAYRNPRHPEHAAVSARVSAHYKRTAGTNPYTL